MKITCAKHLKDFNQHAGRVAEGEKKSKEKMMKSAVSTK
jgi:hypothetical protein